MIGEGASGGGTGVNKKGSVGGGRGKHRHPGEESRLELSWRGALMPGYRFKVHLRSLEERTKARWWNAAPNPERRASQPLLMEEDSLICAARRCSRPLSSNRMCFHMPEPTESGTLLPCKVEPPLPHPGVM
jgi:hypothetical protein